ncbi:MAG: hypothetical protein HGA38_04325 [Candidatus Moranbacteria bacterium]|nr:hypothetical protein [Candidatus Moranbacteria bacterium]
MNKEHQKKDVFPEEQAVRRKIDSFETLSGILTRIYLLSLLIELIALTMILLSAIFLVIIDLSSLGIWLLVITSPSVFLLPFIRDALDKYVASRSVIRKNHRLRPLNITPRAKDRTAFKVLGIPLGLFSVNASFLNIRSILEYRWHPFFGTVLLFLLTSAGFCIFIGWKKPKT